MCVFDRRFHSAFSQTTQVLPPYEKQISCGNNEASFDAYATEAR